MDKNEIENLHKQLLTFWNQQDAKGISSLFADDGNVVGFDGSQIDGRSAIETEMARIFTNHKTASYVWKVREVRFLHTGIALLRAVVGMMPPGKKEINPATNAIQSLIAIKQNSEWKIALFQNTPAQFHGRPELSERLTTELNELIES
jgi:uncharacterized protein (TIGR02246 family)